MSNQKTVAIITSTIGRQELHRAIRSVQAQHYPCKHYVFVDGEKYADEARKILVHYPDVVATYLPMNTGANGWVNSSINAIAPFLVNEDIICYLDDDNWYEPNHVASLVEELASGANFAYSLRNLYSQEGEFIYTDDIESLGAWYSKVKEPYPIIIQTAAGRFTVGMSGFYQRHHIDTNCYAFPRQTAIDLTKAWFSGIYNDRNILDALSQLQSVGRCSSQYTVNYSVNLDKMFHNARNVFRSLELADHQIDELLKRAIRHLSEDNIKAHGGKPWAEKYNK